MTMMTRNSKGRRGSPNNVISWYVPTTLHLGTPNHNLQVYSIAINNRLCVLLHGTRLHNTYVHNPIFSLQIRGLACLHVKVNPVYTAHSSSYLD